MESNLFGEVFSKLAANSQYTDAELARRLNVNRSTIGRWKLGIQSPPLSKIAAIASLFNVHPRVFVGDFEDKNTAEDSIKQEMDLLRKFDALDEKGRHTVSLILNLEYDRCVKSE